MLARNIILKSLWKEIIYIFFSVIYCIRLNALNNVLPSYHEGTSVQEALNILGYDNWKPMWYFGYACIFALIGVVLVIYKVKPILRAHLEIEYILWYIIAIIMILIVLIVIWILISNPIVRLIMIVIGAGGIGFYLFSES